MSEVKPIDILVRAKKFLERGWCQGDLAQDELGRIVSPIDPSACQWCAGGAIEAAVWDLNDNHHPEAMRLDMQLQFARDDAESMIEDVAGTSDIAKWNDSVENQSDVITGFEWAIWKLKRKELLDEPGN